MAPAPRGERAGTAGGPREPLAGTAGGGPARRAVAQQVGAVLGELDRPPEARARPAGRATVEALAHREARDRRARAGVAAGRGGVGPPAPRAPARQPTAGMRGGGGARGGPVGTDRG